MNLLCSSKFLIPFLIIFLINWVFPSNQTTSEPINTDNLDVPFVGTRNTGGSSGTSERILKATCGFPGSPRNGRVLHLLERYQEGMVVTYECDPDYYLLGPITRTCLANSTWSSRMPLCDQSVKNLGLTSASEALNNYPPQLAVDGNSRTCFFSNRRKPRWWRVELPRSTLKNQSIISVALTLPPINAELFFSIYIIEIESLNENESQTNSDSETSETDGAASTTSTSSKYHKCATFRGVFSSKTIFVQCTSPNIGGLRGNYLQIEDDYPQLEYFGLCEVEVFVEKNRYECGQVEIPANGFVVEQQITNDGVRSVEYRCHEGFRLIGDAKRRCDTQTGQWVDQEPYCERITCPEPTPIPNGFHRVYGDYYDMSVVGTRTVYECRPGFVFKVQTNDTRVCNQDGQWNGDIPECEPIDCAHPESLLVNPEDFFLSGAQFRLINGTTEFSSLAELICSPQDVIRGNLTRSNLWFRCREDGIWTEITTNINNFGNFNESQSSSNRIGSSGSCVKQRHNGFLYFYVYGTKGFFRKNFYIRETSINILHLLAFVVFASFLSILIIVFLLFKRNIIEIPSSNAQSYCLTSIKWIKLSGQLIVKFFIWSYVSIRSFLESFNCKYNRKGAAVGDAGSGDEDEDKKSSKSTPPYTITPSTSDLESGRSSLDQRQQSIGDQHIDIEKNGSCSNEKKDDLNTALATFYEEITNAAKLMFSEETDRKLLRAARIAAELDSIKNQTEHSNHMAANNYHQWIYSTPPRYGSSNTSTSLPPSLHEYHQIVPVTNSQIYAKVDLIRKHRYRKERQEITSVYQVPKPRCKTELNNCLLDNHHSHPYHNYSTIARRNSAIANYHQLRKAISTPDRVFTIDNDYGNCEYGTIRKLVAFNNQPNHQHMITSIDHHSPPHIHEPINKYPLKTLL